MNRTATAGSDPINRPSHYQGRNGMEVYDILKEFMEPYQLEGWHKGNALKYILRAGIKDPDKATEDLQKAVWHLDKLAWIWESEQ